MSTIGVRNLRALKLRKALKPGGGSLKNVIDAAEDDSSSILQSINKLEKFSKKKKAKAQASSKQLAWHEEYQRLQDKLRNLERDIDLVIAPFLDAPLRSEAEEEEKEEGSEGTETMNASQSSVQQVPFKGKEEGEGAEDSESVAGAVSPDSLAEGSGGDSGEGADAAPSRRGIRFADDSKPPAATTTSGSAGNRQSEAKSNTLLLGRYWDALTAEREADNAALLSQFRGIHMLLGSLKRLRADTAAAEAAPQIDSLSSNLGRVLQSLRESLRNSTKTLEKEGHLLEEEVNACYRTLVTSLRGNGEDDGLGGGRSVASLASTTSSIGAVDDDVLMQIVDEIGGEKISDMSLKLEAFQHLCGLRDLYLADQEEEQDAWQQQCHTLGVPAAEAAGGWDKANHDRFLKIVDEEKAKGKANMRKRILARLTGELPQVGELDSVIHLDWWEEKSAHQRRVRDRKQTWIRERSEAIKKWRTRFMAAMDKEEANLARDMEAKAMLALKMKKQKRLEQLRNEKIKELTEAAAKKRQLAAMEAAAEQEVEEANARYRSMMKQRLGEQMATASGVKAVESIVKEEEARVAKEEEKKRAEHDWERIEHRDELFRQKLEEKRLAEEQAAAEEAEKAARLAEIIESAPYHERLQAIVPDAARTRQHTKASQLAEDYTYAALAMQGATMSGLYEFNEDMGKRVTEMTAKEKGLFRNPGYTDEKLFSDVRFQLAVALRDAGLHKSEYARQVMSTMQPTMPNALQTSAQFPFSK